MISVLAFIVIVATIIGMIGLYFQLEKDRGQSQNQSEQLLYRYDQLLGKFDQLIASLLAALAAAPAKKKTRKRPRKTAATDEAKGGSDGDSI